MKFSELLAILDEINYRDWSFAVGVESRGFTLQVQFRAGTAGEEQRGRKWRISEHMTRSEVVQTALMAVLAAEEHEARERFLYRGEAIFFPHFDVDDLWLLKNAGSCDARGEKG